MTDKPDRRPIAARNLPQVIAVAAWLIQRRASPDAISVVGMVAAMCAGTAIALTHGMAPGLGVRCLWLLGAALIQVRLMANLLDGMVAIGRNVASATGELFNEVPDRISDTAVLVGVGVACGQPALGWAAALVAMATAYIRAVGKGCGLASDFSGPMAKQQRMAVMTALGVAGAVLPWAWLPTLAATALWVVVVLALATAARRLIHIAHALRGARA